MSRRYNIKGLNGLYLGYKTDEVLTLFNYKTYLFEDYDFFPTGKHVKNLEFLNSNFVSNNFIGSNSKAKSNTEKKYSEITIKESLSPTQKYINEFYLHFRFYGGENLATTNGVPTDTLRRLRVQVKIAFGSTIVGTLFNDLTYYINDDSTINMDPDSANVIDENVATTKDGIAIRNWDNFTVNQEEGDTIYLSFNHSKSNYGGYKSFFETYKNTTSGYNFRVKCFTPIDLAKAVGNNDYKIIVNYFNEDGTTELMSESIVTQISASQTLTEPLNIGP